MSDYRIAFKIVMVTFVIGVSLTPLSGFAQSFVMKPADPVFRPEVLGFNSRAANPADWPATFVFRNVAGTECTATAIGEQVILTAAHCVTTAAVGKIELGQSKLDINCQHHSRYPANRSADFSLCRVAAPLKAPGSGFEMVNANASIMREGVQVKLLGFGCRYSGGADQTFGRLSEGDAKIRSVETDYVVTGGGAAICLGDSGGGAYVAIDDFGLRRRLVAVNSYGDLSYFSWLSVTSSPLFMNWAKKWSADHQNVTICGLHHTARDCHQ